MQDVSEVVAKTDSSCLFTDPAGNELYNFRSGEQFRWYLQVLSATDQMMDSFENVYTKSVQDAFRAQQKKRLYVDLSESQTSMSISMAFRVSRLILSNRKYTSELYESVVVLLPKDQERARTIRSILEKVFLLVQNLSPIRIYIDKSEAKRYHLGDELPVQNHAEFVY